MKKTIFKGAGVAIVTPMNNDGTVNYDTLEKLIDFQLKSSTDAIIVCGTTGESATLNQSERNKVIEFTLKQVNGKIPVIAGSGSNNTETALRLSKEAEEMGVDGLLIVTPYYSITFHLELVITSFPKPINIYLCILTSAQLKKPAETYRQWQK